MTGDQGVIERVSSIDDSSRWVLRHRPDGRFDYAEYRFVDLRPDGQVEGYWARYRTSGLFETAQAAKDDALDTITWLSEQL